MRLLTVKERQELHRAMQVIDTLPVEKQKTRHQGKKERERRLRRQAQKENKDV